MINKEVCEEFLSTLLECGIADIEVLLDLIYNAMIFTGKDMESIINEEKTFGGISYNAIIWSYEKLKRLIVEYICNTIEDCDKYDVESWVDDMIENDKDNIYLNYLDINTGADYMDDILLYSEIEKGLKRAYEHYLELYKEENGRLR